MPALFASERARVNDILADIQLKLALPLDGALPLGPDRGFLEPSPFARARTTQTRVRQIVPFLAIPHGLAALEPRLG